MKYFATLSLSILLAGCATPTVVDTRKVGDSELTCDQIKQEIAEAERFDKEARKERTVTGTNVAAAIFFWPALLGTYANTEEAINAAKERKENMLKLADSKGCNVLDSGVKNKPAEVAAGPDPKTLAPASGSLTSSSNSVATASTERKSISTKETQTRLASLGYKVGTPDGISGNRTVEAIKKFQLDNQLPSSGKMDEPTTAKLIQMTSSLVMK